MHAPAFLPPSAHTQAVRRTSSLFENHVRHAYRLQRTADEVAVHDVATVAVGFFDAAETALAPVIGLQGVAALYKRSLRLVCVQHPWLAVTYGAGTYADALMLLQAALRRQNLHTATQAVQALLAQFRELLTALVGPALTTRMLSKPVH